MSTPASCHSPARPDRFTPQLERLEDRCLMTCSVVLRGSILRIVGDQGPNAVTISDNGLTGDITVFCDGFAATFGRPGTGIGFNFIRTDAFARPPLTRFFARPLTQIAIDTGRGNDIVSYTLNNDLLKGISRSVVADLGRGNDAFFADLTNRVLAGSLRFIVNGEHDFDTMKVTAADTDIRRNAVLGIDLSGGRENDFFEINYDGTLDGRLSTFVQGERGNDVVDARFFVDSISTRAPITVLEGGPQDDRLTLIVDAPEGFFAGNAIGTVPVGFSGNRSGSFGFASSGSGFGGGASTSSRLSSADVNSFVRLGTGAANLFGHFDGLTGPSLFDRLTPFFNRSRVFALVDGGSGANTCVATPNVIVNNC